MKGLKHANIIEIIAHGEVDYKKPKGSKNVFFIAIEIAERGQLFDFVSVGGPFEEPLARHWFRQFTEGLDFCHKAGVFHRDIKPENLLIDENFNLRIADFGFAK